MALCQTSRSSILGSALFQFLSAESLRPLRLGGESISAFVHCRDAELAENAQRITN